MAIPFEDTLGALTSSSSRPGWWLAALGVVAALTWVAVAFSVGLPVTVSSVDGRVVSAIEPMDVTSNSEEPIALLPFKLGDAVVVGDVLIQFNALPLQLELEASEYRAAALNEEITSVEREMSAASASLVSELDSYDRALERLEARILETRAELEHAAKAEQLYAELRHERRIDELQYSRARAELEKVQLRLQAQHSESNELLANRRLAISRNDTTQAQLSRQRAQLQGEVTSLAPEQRTRQVRIDELTVRAPFAGEIGAIAPVTVGQTVPPGGWLMTLVPTRSYEFQATFAARESAGRLREGQPARIQFHALPWTEYGTLDARVLRVGSEERNGTVRVDFALASDAPLTAQLSHGLKGLVTVQIDQATLAQRLIRLLGAPRSPNVASQSFAR